VSGKNKSLREEGICGSVHAIMHEYIRKRLRGYCQLYKDLLYLAAVLFSVLSNLNFLLGGGRIWYSRECERLYCTEARKTSGF